MGFHNGVYTFVRVAQITPGSLPLETEFCLTANSVSLQQAYHHHTVIGSVWLEYFCKDHIHMYIHPSSHATDCPFIVSQIRSDRQTESSGIKCRMQAHKLYFNQLRIHCCFTFCYNKLARSMSLRVDGNLMKKYIENLQWKKCRVPFLKLVNRLFPFLRFDLIGLSSNYLQKYRMQSVHKWFTFITFQELKLCSIRFFLNSEVLNLGIYGTCSIWCVKYFG